MEEFSACVFVYDVANKNSYKIALRQAEKLAKVNDKIEIYIAANKIDIKPDEGRDESYFVKEAAAREEF